MGIEEIQKINKLKFENIDHIVGNLHLHLMRESKDNIIKSRFSQPC